MRTYYLWNGIGAIEDLEDCATLEEAVKALAAKVTGDWTLWQRDDRPNVRAVRLVAIHLPHQREIRTGGNGGMGVFEEFVFE